jgi:hypothetical protein
MADQDPIGIYHEHAVPGAECPRCGHHFNAASALRTHGDRPKPGDLTVCVECAVILAFTEGLVLRPLSEEEIKGLDVSILVDLAVTIRAIRIVQRRRALARAEKN